MKAITGKFEKVGRKFISVNGEFPDLCANHLQKLFKLGRAKTIWVTVTLRRPASDYAELSCVGGVVGSDMLALLYEQQEDIKVPTTLNQDAFVCDAFPIEVWTGDRPFYLYVEYEE